MRSAATLPDTCTHAHAHAHAHVVCTPLRPRPHCIRIPRAAHRGTCPPSFPSMPFARRRPTPLTPPWPHSQGIVPLPLDATQTASLVEEMKTSQDPKLLALLEHRVPPGVDEAPAARRPPPAARRLPPPAAARTPRGRSRGKRRGREAEAMCCLGAGGVRQGGLPGGPRQRDGDERPH